MGLLELDVGTFDSHSNEWVDPDMMHYWLTVHTCTCAVERINVSFGCGLLCISSFQFLQLNYRVHEKNWPLFTTRVSEAMARQCENFFYLLLEIKKTEKQRKMNHTRLKFFWLTFNYLVIGYPASHYILSIKLFFK